MARLEISSINPTGRWQRIDENFVELYAARTGHDNQIGDQSSRITALEAMIGQLYAEICRLKEKSDDVGLREHEGGL